MIESDSDSLNPHRTGLRAGVFLACASAVFAMIAIAIMLSGHDSFEVVLYGLDIENRYLRALLLPPMTFCIGYAFTYTVCRIVIATKSSDGH
ncbi:MAG: hypothetical protein ACFHXK_00910 [bacterium]